MEKFTMTRVFFGLVLTGVLCLSGMPTSALAQSGPGGAQPAQPGLPSVQPNQMVKLNVQNLPQMVQAAGFQIQPMNYANGQQYWRATIQLNGWGYVVDVRPGYSAQGQITNFWLSSDLNTPIAANGMPASTLLKLLEKNHTSLPYFFSYNAATSKLCLNYEHPFNDSNQQEIQKELTEFCNKIRDTYPLWSGNGQVPVNMNPIVPVNMNPIPVAPVVPNGVANIAGTTWNGQENISGGWTGITFQFQANGQAIMTLQGGASYYGNWTQSGNQVTMQFPTVSNSFTGTINGNAINGQGQDKVGPWNFNVTKSN
jgi:hypothetical protein